MQSNRETIILLVVFTTIVILILILFVLLFLYLYQRRQIVYQKNLDSLKSEYEKSLLNSELEIQEQTLQNISREIHDNIGLSLTLAKLNLTSLDNIKTGFQAGKIGESANLIGKALKDLSDISHSLNSNVISNNGLLKAVEEEALRITSISKLKVNIVISGESIFMDDQKELLLFRIVQEALHNILKYAGASLARIELNYDSESLQLKIKDDGCGFDINQRKERTGSGLLNMRARTKIMNGIFLLESNSKGTSIYVKIPIKK